MLVIAATIGIPLVVSPHGTDVFRLPKALLLEAEAIVLTGLLSAVAILRPSVLRERFHVERATILAFLVLIWCAVSAVAATNRSLSSRSLLWVFSAVVIYLVTNSLMRTYSVHIIAIVLAPALINSVLALLQESHVWNPFFTKDAATMYGHFVVTAFVGNPNYTGTYLVAPALTAIAAMCAVRRYRTFYGASALIIVVALVLTQTVTAIAALAVGAVSLLLIVLRPKPPYLIGAMLIGGALAVGIVTAVPSLHARVQLMHDAFHSRQYEQFSSNRLMPVLSAYRMFRDHPIVGVGPGCFAWNYLPYRLRVQQQYPRLIRPYEESFRDIERLRNFGEAHSDHLQVLAETGLPGYLLFLAAGAALALNSFQSRLRSADERSRFSKFLSAPLAASLLLLCVAQFPMELAASLTSILFVVACCNAWSNA